MGFETIRLEVEGAVATLTVDRPKALNALNSKALEELLAAVTQVHQQSGVRVLLVTGAGEKAFVAGADIAQMANYSAEEALAFSRAGHKVMAALEALPFPTIAAVNGFALGGGCELALACDLIYASEKAKFGLPEVTLAVIPGFGGTQRLARRTGLSRAKELVYTGEMIDASKAKEYHLVLEVLPVDKLLGHCREVAGKIASRGPLAVTKAKTVIAQGWDLDLAAGNELESQAFGSLFATADQKEGMQAFLEKRAAAFKGL
ncbi:MAG: enoyl-CoA hydratase/isomerase family protein [Myxococcaceae bacterium]|nr:enoyl-CoA hydratase/isomerase family protein [Myxococcaceae bacterium]